MADVGLEGSSGSGKSATLLYLGQTLLQEKHVTTMAVYVLPRDSRLKTGGEAAGDGSLKAETSEVMKHAMGEQQGLLLRNELS